MFSRLSIQPRASDRVDKAYNGPRTLLNSEDYHKRCKEVAQIQSDLMNGDDCAIAAAVTALIEYQDDLKYIRFLEQEILCGGQAGKAPDC